MVISSDIGGSVCGGVLVPLAVAGRRQRPVERGKVLAGRRTGGALSAAVQGFHVQGQTAFVVAGVVGHIVDQAGDAQQAANQVGPQLVHQLGVVARGVGEPVA